jgi:dTDP-4-amino-4,6-dideoxygalactose transaminase
MTSLGRVASTFRRAQFLPFSPPLIGDEEIAEVVDALRSGWITTGPRTRRFEAQFAEYLGAPGALALNSCTAALHTYRDKYAWRAHSFPVAYANYERMLSLPLSLRLSETDMGDVIEAVLDVVLAYRR